MTRMCAEKGCNAPHLGEKCPECGSEKLLLLNVDTDFPPDWFECPKGHVFQEGITLTPPSITHGICESCLEKRRQEVESAARY